MFSENIKVTLNHPFMIHQMRCRQFMKFVTLEQKQNRPSAPLIADHVSSFKAKEIEDEVMTYGADHVSSFKAKKIEDEVMSYGVSVKATVGQGEGREPPTPLFDVTQRHDHWMTSKWAEQTLGD